MTNFIWFRWDLCLLAILSSALCIFCPVLAQKRIDPTMLEEFCKNFTHGNPNELEFFSPMYPKEYPESVICFRTLTADFGYFIRVDFRDGFKIEPPSNEGRCDYDYLEIRDGGQGYSPLIGKSKLAITSLTYHQIIFLHDLANEINVDRTFIHQFCKCSYLWHWYF